MSDTVISVEGISKLYRLGEVGTGTLSHDLNRWWHRVRGREDPYLKIGQSNERTKAANGSDFIWALKNVSFEVKRGEVLGLIGRNGAGKSTLLKILSRVTTPTSGEIKAKGRIASLLEVGTGFNPELTGRDNIYLNGAILGMRKREIDRKFDEIVAFAEVERYIDTPVKRYSSGMYVRLAFAVAAHLEPEILIVDEVLAVGDAGFQKKCLGKMSEVSRQDGRTVLFVSHNMVAVQGLCSRAIWLREGKVVSDGDCARVVSDYSTKGAIVQIDQQWDDVSTAPGNEQVRIHRIQVHSTDKSSRNWITMETPICIAIDFWNLVPNASLAITLHVYTEQGIVAFGTSSVAAQGWETRPFPAGHFQAACSLPGNLLNSGMHRINLLVVKDQSHVIHQMEDAVSFEVHDAPESRGAWYGKLAGAVRPKLEWSVDCQPSTISNNHKPIL